MSTAFTPSDCCASAAHEGDALGCIKPDLVRGKKPEVKSGEAVANILRCARLKAEPFGHHRQASTQLPVALLEMISNFAAFKRSEHRVGNSPPGHSLPLLQLVDLAAQDIRLSHAVGPLFEKWQVKF
jgi:hypothetical protein